MPMRTLLKTRSLCKQFNCNWLRHGISHNSREPTRIVLGLKGHYTMESPIVSTISRHQYNTTAPSVDTESMIDSTAEVNDSQDTSDKLRRVLRKVPFPVVVVSTSSPHDPSLRRGITISSFSSISLQPIPLISFCVKLPSRASTILHESDKFIVQFLASDQIPHSVAFSSSVPPPAGVKAALKGSDSALGGSTDNSRYSKSKRVPKDKDIEELVSEASRQTLLENKSDSTINSSSSGEDSKNVEINDESTNTFGEVTDPCPFEVLGYNTDPESNLPVLKGTLGALRCKTHKVMVVGDHEMWIGQVERILHGEIPDQQEPLLYHDRSYRKVGRRIL